MTKSKTENIGENLVKGQRGKEDSDSVWSTTDAPHDSVDHIINVRVSDAKLRDLKERAHIGRRIKSFFGHPPEMTVSEFNHQIRRLYKCCLKSVKDLHELHIRRSLGMDILEDIIERVNPNYISMSHVIHLIWCIMSCMHHFQLRLRTSESGIISWARKKKSENCLLVYEKLIKMFDIDMYRIAVNAIITFYREGRLWEIEFACTELIIDILEIHHYVKEDLDDIIYTIEVSTVENVQEAKFLTKILCEITEGIKWKDMTMYLIIQIIDMMESSINPKTSDYYNYVCLRKTLELCIRQAVKNLYKKYLIRVLFILINRMNINSTNKEIVLYFGNIAIYTAHKYKIRAGGAPLAFGPLPRVFSLFKTNTSIMSLFGLKIWQRLIDRHYNARYFLTPRIFFRESDYHLVLKKCNPKDKAFFKKARHLMYKILLNSFLISDNKAKLEIVYQTIALTLIELPCGYSASCVVTIAMSIQEYAFRIMSKNLVRSHHLHATVLALLTLICYINNATVFYQYVNTIIQRRAEWAPHLNPPLKTKYEYAQHHILWNKPELFFEDWEVRYGLWKCFRVPKKHIRKTKYRTSKKNSSI